MKPTKIFNRIIRQSTKEIVKRYYYFFIILSLRTGKTVSLHSDSELLNSLWKKKRISCYHEADGSKKVNYDLSIIIPLYNSENFVNKLVSCLMAQKTKYKYEIILVDDGSTDKTLQELKQCLKSYNENTDKIEIIKQKK